MVYPPDVRLDGVNSENQYINQVNMDLQMEDLKRSICHLLLVINSGFFPKFTFEEGKFSLDKQESKCFVLYK